MDRNAEAAKVARALGLSTDSIGRYAREGRIPFDTTPGGHRRYNVEEVRQALSPSSRLTSSGGQVPMFGVPAATRRARAIRSVTTPAASLTGSAGTVDAPADTGGREAASAATGLLESAWKVHRSVLVTA